MSVATVIKFRHIFASYVHINKTLYKKNKPKLHIHVITKAVCHMIPTNSTFYTPKNCKELVEIYVVGNG
jgi:hypothetical protein